MLFHAPRTQRNRHAAGNQKSRTQGNRPHAFELAFKHLPRDVPIRGEGIKGEDLKKIFPDVPQILEMDVFGEAAKTDHPRGTGATYPMIMRKPTSAEDFGYSGYEFGFWFDKLYENAAVTFYSGDGGDFEILLYDNSKRLVARGYLAPWMERSQWRSIDLTNIEWYEGELEPFQGFAISARGDSWLHAANIDIERITVL